ncbi:MAG: hypothetical protein KAJ66_01595 [Candidatus Omnitrophica bacterium]|nr:hypothetical protein [Candidatus Omnitrophota bacterium]
MKPGLVIFNTTRMLTILAISVTTMALAGCGATRFNLKSASLKDGDPYSELRYESRVDKFTMYIPKIYVHMDSGEVKKDLIVDKDSIAKMTGKLIFMVTPFGMIANLMDTADRALCVPTGHIELFIAMKGMKCLSKGQTNENKTEDKFLLSVWNYKVPVNSESGERYTVVYDREIIVKNDKGSVVSRILPEAILEDRESNEKAYVLSKASEQIVEKGKYLSHEMDIKLIPIYADKNGNLVVISGAIDISQIAIEKGKWILEDKMIINTGRRPFSINDIVLKQGEYLIKRSGKYIKSSLGKSIPPSPENILSEIGG